MQTAPIDLGWECTTAVRGQYLKAPQALTVFPTLIRWIARQQSLHWRLTATFSLCRDLKVKICNRWQKARLMQKA